MDETDLPSTNLFDNIDILQRSVLGRTVLGWAGDSQEGSADVFIVKTILGGLEDREQCSDASQLKWFRRIRRNIVRKVATSSRATHWAAEIRGDLYETFRRKEYRLPWEWKATILLTAKEDVQIQQERKVVERLRIGTTALSNAEIARRGKIDSYFEQEIAAD